MSGTMSYTNRYNAVVQQLVRDENPAAALSVALDICCALWDLLPRDLEEAAAKQIEALAKERG